MQKAVYCLVQNEVVEYVGVSSDPERRYKQHCRLSNNTANTPRWDTSRLEASLAVMQQAVDAIGVEAMNNKLWERYGE